MYTLMYTTYHIKRFDNKYQMFDVEKFYGTEDPVTYETIDKDNIYIIEEKDRQFAYTKETIINLYNAQKLKCKNPLTNLPLSEKMLMKLKKFVDGKTLILNHEPTKRTYYYNETTLIGDVILDINYKIPEFKSVLFLYDPTLPISHVLAPHCTPEYGFTDPPNTNIYNKVVEMQLDKDKYERAKYYFIKFLEDNKYYEAMEMFRETYHKPLHSHITMFKVLYRSIKNCKIKARATVDDHDYIEINLRTFLKDILIFASQAEMLYQDIPKSVFKTRFIDLIAGRVVDPWNFKSVDFMKKKGSIHNPPFPINTFQLPKYVPPS